MDFCPFSPGLSWWTFRIFFIFFSVPGRGRGGRRPRRLPGRRLKKNGGGGGSEEEAREGEGRRGTVWEGGGG